MNRRILVVSVLLSAVGCSSVAFAIAPLGPPTASLAKGQFGLSAEYAYSDSDWEISLGDNEATLEGVVSNVFLAQLGYGLTDDWEIYVPLGVAEHETADYKFAYGLGTKLTFEKVNDWSWGLLFEIGWRSGEDSGTVDFSEFGLGVVNAEVDFSYYDITVALGPTWKVAEGIRLYGGPFFYVLEGDVDYEITGLGDLSLDLGEKSLFGGYIGAELDICPNSSWYGEFQLTGDMMVFGTGISWKF